MTTKKGCLYKGEIYDMTEVEPTNHWDDDVTHGYSNTYDEYVDTLIDYAA